MFLLLPVAGLAAPKAGEPKVDPAPNPGEPKVVPAALAPNPEVFPPKVELAAPKPPPAPNVLLAAPKAGAGAPKVLLGPRLPKVPVCGPLFRARVGGPAWVLGGMFNTLCMLYKVRCTV